MVVDQHPVLDECQTHRLRPMVLQEQRHPEGCDYDYRSQAKAVRGAGRLDFCADDGGIGDGGGGVGQVAAEVMVRRPGQPLNLPKSFPSAAAGTSSGEMAAGPLSLLEDCSYEKVEYLLKHCLGPEEGGIPWGRPGFWAD